MDFIIYQERYKSVHFKSIKTESNITLIHVISTTLNIPITSTTLNIPITSNTLKVPVHQMHTITYISYHSLLNEFLKVTKLVNNEYLQISYLSNSLSTIILYTTVIIVNNILVF